MSEQFKRFDALSRAVLTVSKEEIRRREDEYKKQASLNPKKRGPKRKSKPSVGPGPDAS
jgi:hypothetical protein